MQNASGVPEPIPAQPDLARVLEPEALMAGDEADGYDRLVRRHAWILNRPFVNRVARHAGLRARVLDIGSGPGWIPIELATRRGGWEVHGVDASGDMVARAARNAKAEGVANRVHFHRADGTALPFESASFDLVISHYVLHHLERPEELFNEAARLVRPGGSVMIKDLRRPPAWAIPALTGFARSVLCYNEAQARMYRESMCAALSMAELRAALGRSHLWRVRVRGTLGLEFIVTAEGHPKGCGSFRTEIRSATLAVASGYGSASRASFSSNIPRNAACTLFQRAARCASGSETNRKAEATHSPPSPSWPEAAQMFCAPFVNLG